MGSAYAACMLCPNACGVNRLKGQIGRCGERDAMRIAWSGLHRGEEPPVTGRKGSGMIFFCGCPLHCAFCQNHQISGETSGTAASVGIEISIEELSDLMLALQRMGANNINFVTGTHFIPSICASLDLARKKGMHLPIVWNTSGYESQVGLQLINPYVDLYLIDLKTLSHTVAARFCGLARYADIIKDVFGFLMKNCKPYKETGPYDTPTGLLVRHLVFPGTLRQTRRVLRYFVDSGLSKVAELSLMVQFVAPRPDDPDFPPMSEGEYTSLLDMADEAGIEDGYIQELGDDIQWIPDFRKDVPFPVSFCDPNPLFLELKHQRVDETV